MVDALVVSLFEQLALVTRLEQEIKLVAGVSKNVKNLSTVLTLIRGVIEDAEKKQIHEKTVKLWLEDLKDIMYDADDVLDEWSTRMLLAATDPQIMEANGSYGTTKVLSCLSSPCTCLNLVFVCHEIAHRIKGIRERLDVSVRNKDQLNLVAIQSHEEPRRLTSSVVDAAEICGRNHDKEEIVRRLLSETSHQESLISVGIVSIVGMGGLGKTTLAQLVLKEERVVTTFELIMWVCVSEPFDLRRVVSEIIEQATGRKPDAVGWQSLHLHLCESLKGRHFVLVLDDVWTTDSNYWNQLKISLDGAARGSKIILTTRNEGVAAMMGSIYIHTLSQLSDNDCWSMFRKIAFWGRPKEELEGLEQIGKNIAKKCKGVPLAAKTLASLMRFMPTDQDWRNVLASDIWEFQQVEDVILPALLLSYYALPSHLKQCFTYCATFPKDEKMEKDRLVKLWMAQGFLGCDERKELEMIGGRYFDDLVMRSYFQNFEKDKSGRISKCKMNDLVHDFAQFLTESECYGSKQGITRFSEDKVRHITVCELEVPSISKLKKLRTLILRSSRPNISELFSQLTCLRALDLSGYDLEELPADLDKFLHLRYLDLSDTRLRELPETVCNLYNLQTLRLNNCRLLCKLPQEIGKLCNLRHLEFEDTSALAYIPRGIRRLKNLRTLSTYIINSANGGCTIRDLHDLNHLTGNVEITGLRQVVNVVDVVHAKLSKKENIRSLKLKFGHFLQENQEVGEDDIKRMEGVFGHLDTPFNLKELEVDGYPGLKFPSWMSSETKLCWLVNLELNQCKLSTKLPALGNLRVESLFIGGLVSVRSIGAKFYGAEVGEATSFPKLRKLVFHDMTGCEDWKLPFSKNNNIMPQLRHLTLSSFPRLVGLPALGRLQSLESLDLCNITRMERLGVDLLGISSLGGGGGEQEEVAFPSLTTLAFRNMDEWKEWNLPLTQKEKPAIMPHLCQLVMHACPKLEALPALGKLQSLEHLSLCNLPLVKHLSFQLLGISGSGSTGNGASSSSSQVLFPKLRDLKLDSMPQWEGDDLVNLHMASASSIMPCLHTLEINTCGMLKVIPRYMLSESLRKVSIKFCPRMTGLPCCIPPLLEHLELAGDVGALSRSIIPVNTDNNSSYSIHPNLKSLLIIDSLHSSLPEGSNQFTGLQELRISRCKLLDLEPEEFRKFPMLCRLEITDCPILIARCRQEWSTLSHILDIIIDNDTVTEARELTS